MRASQFRELIVGIKVAHYTGPEWEPVDRAVEAGGISGVPVMVDFGGHKPPLSLRELLVEHLRPGDILTHAYAHVDGRMPIVGDDGKVESFAREARSRGIIFDVGHGAGSFVYRQVVPAMASGFTPDTISTDLHIRSMNAGMKDLLNVMSKFLNLGMSIQDVILKSTWAPARVIGHEELGHLSPGAGADITVLNLQSGSFGFIDSEGRKLAGTQRLNCELVLRDGRVVWDLNGRAALPWEDRTPGK
jgi:dihydroorotase